MRYHQGRGGVRLLHRQSGCSQQRDQPRRLSHSRRGVLMPVPLGHPTRSIARSACGSRKEAPLCGGRVCSRRTDAGFGEPASEGATPALGLGFGVGRGRFRAALTGLGKLVEPPGVSQALGRLFVGRGQDPPTGLSGSSALSGACPSGKGVMSTRYRAGPGHYPSWLGCVLRRTIADAQFDGAGAPRIATAALAEGGGGIDRTELRGEKDEDLDDCCDDACVLGGNELGAGCLRW